MKRLLLILFTAASLLSFGNSKISERIDYIQNNGQWESPVLFKANLFGGWVFLEKDALTFKFIENHHHHPAKSDKDDIIKGHVYKINWLNANENVKVTAEDKQPYYNNYFIGNNQKKWKSNVGNFQTIRYNNIYPNIDFKIYSEATSMKSDYIIHKNGDVQSLKFNYDGVDAISIEKDGKLKITTSINTIYEYKPYAYQIINGKQVEVACSYVLNNTTLSFQLPNGYDKTTDLVIDPTLVFSSYSGSISDNWGSSATHDNAGNMFLGGIALGASYPTTVGAFQTTFAGGSGFQFSDIAITKFNATGTAKLYSTYLGGSSNELLASLLCTPNNELIAVMTTGSSDFPTTANAFDRTFNGGSSVTAYEISMPNGADIAITKLNEAGSALIGSTFFGGTGNDGTNTNTSTSFNYGDASRSDVALDNNGNIYVTSTTTSTNIPNTVGKAQANNGGGSSDGLLAKFNSDLSVLNWASYFGGTGTDASYSMALDKNNNIFICGGTTSSNIPGRTSGLNTSYRGGSADGFAAKFDNNGNNVLVSTYLGTNDYDQAYIMDLDNSDNVYFFGQTLGLYPVTAGVYSNTGAPQFIHKLNNNLNNTIFSTVFGSVNSTEINITPTALLVDVCSNIYAVGWGGNVNNSGSTFGMAVTSDAYKSNTDGSDFYLFNLSANATNLIYASYFGENGGVGDHVDGGTSRFDKSGIVYEAVCASCGGTNSFPVTTGVVGTNNNSSNCNMAGFKFRFDLTGLQIITATATPSSGCAPLAVNFTYTSTQPGTEYFWDFGDGTTSTIQFPSHTYTAGGTYNVRFILRDPLNCNPVDSTTLIVTAGQRKTNTVNRTICQGQSVTIGNQTFTASGTYNITLQAVGGCDSIVTLNLNVSNRIINNINKTICEGQVVIVGNNSYSQSGNYSDTIPSSSSCDSIINLSLTVNPKKSANINRTICQGQSVTIGNQTYNTSGNFTVTTQTSLGCDSTINLNLLVNPVKSTSITRTICEGQTVEIGNQVFTTAGSYSITLQSSQNCDSTVNLALIVNPTKTTNLVRAICEGSTVTIGTQTFNTTGNYSVKLQGAQTCDSVVNLALTVNPTDTTTLDYTVCTGTIITIGNETFSTSGNYTVRLQTSKGCDSIVFLNLTETDTIIQNINATICLGQEYSAGNQTFTQQGNYTINLLATAGCDSVINLSLSVIDTVRENINRIICDGDSIIIGTQTIKEAGNYSIALTSSAGCDSLVNLSLIVLEKKITNIRTEICEGKSITIGNQTFSEAGNYTIELRSSEGCDSTVNLTLIVNPLPDINAVADRTTALPDEQIQLNVLSAETLSYNWTPIELLNNSTIQNPTAYITTPTWFVVTAENETTLCTIQDSVFVDLEFLPCVKENIFIPNAFTPNGDDQNDKLFVRTTILKSFHFEIYDRWGHKVFETNSIAEGWDGNYKGQPAQVETYGYFLSGECLQGDKISLKGNLTLLR
ncbi:MAG TPA: PKD domain-containing protein [Chitinophagales bacterium]|nr:PKD domain-containing protein [Chitinophagales bacterium]